MMRADSEVDSAPGQIVDSFKWRGAHFAEPTRDASRLNGQRRNAVGLGVSVRRPVNGLLVRWMGRPKESSIIGEQGIAQTRSWPHGSWGEAQGWWVEREGDPLLFWSRRSGG
jgi:hypothetical protein